MSWGLEEWRAVVRLVGRGLSWSLGWIGKEECLSIGRLME